MHDVSKNYIGLFMDILKKEFTTQELLKVVGITRTRLQPWVERGYISPSVQCASVQGVKHLYSIYDIYKVAVFKYLLEYGFSRDRAGTMVKNWSFIEGAEKKYHVLCDFGSGHSAQVFSFDERVFMAEVFRFIQDDVVLNDYSPIHDVFISNITDQIEDVNQKIKEL